MRAFFVAGAVMFTAISIASLAAQSAQAGQKKVYRPGQGVSDLQQAPAQKDDEFARGAYLEKAPGVVPPKIVKQVAPKYTAEAMRNKIQGVVIIEAVVGEDGKVARARVTESLDKQYGLDQAGLDAAGQWEFTAGTFEGRPVPVLVTLKLEFRLHQP